MCVRPLRSPMAPQLLPLVYPGCSAPTGGPLSGAGAEGALHTVPPRFVKAKALGAGVHVCQLAVLTCEVAAAGTSAATQGWRGTGSKGVMCHRQASLESRGAREKLAVMQPTQESRPFGSHFSFEEKPREPLKAPLLRSVSDGMSFWACCALLHGRRRVALRSKAPLLRSTSDTTGACATSGPS